MKTKDTKNQKPCKKKVKQRHGYGGDRIHNIWKAMMYRCYNEDYKYFKTYGGRGIKVCERWHTFINFLEDTKSIYRDDLQLDRVDNDKGYSPENCRFVTRTANCSNKRNNRFITHNGETNTCAEWARRAGISRTGLWNRLKNGWSIEDALTVKSLKMTGQPGSRKVFSSTEARLKRSMTRRALSSSSQEDAAEKPTS